MQEKKEAQAERIPTNLRTLMLLEALGDQDGPVTATDLGRIMGLPKQTVHRLCASLEAQGFLTKERRGYRPGRRARAMASVILHASSAHVARRQILLDLAGEIGETINFAVPEDRGMSYKDRVETNWAFRIQLPIGSHVPFHCTASGKAYLASLPKAERRRLVNAMHLKQLTPKTHTSPETLLAELSQISRRGYAQDDEEFMEGMVATAVQVRDPAGRYYASLAFHGPVQRIQLSEAAGLAPRLSAAAEKLTQLLF